MAQEKSNSELLLSYIRELKSSSANGMGSGAHVHDNRRLLQKAEDEYVARLNPVQKDQFYSLKKDIVDVGFLKQQDETKKGLEELQTRQGDTRSVQEIQHQQELLDKFITARKDHFSAGFTRRVTDQEERQFQIDDKKNLDAYRQTLTPEQQKGVTDVIVKNRFDGRCETLHEALKINQSDAGGYKRHMDFVGKQNDQNDKLEAYLEAENTYMTTGYANRLQYEKAREDYMGTLSPEKRKNAEFIELLATPGTGGTSQEPGKDRTDQLREKFKQNQDAIEIKAVETSAVDQPDKDKSVAQVADKLKSSGMETKAPYDGGQVSFTIADASSIGKSNQIG